MIDLFEKTSSLKVQSVRGLKPVLQDASCSGDYQHRTQDNIDATSSTCGIAQNLDTPYNKVWKILQKSIHFLSIQDQPCTRVMSH